MSLTFTWREQGKADDVWSLSDEALGSLEQFRQTLTDTIFSDGVARRQPRYSDVKDMIKGILTSVLIEPAYVQFPPASVLEADAAVKEAKQAYESAHANAKKAALAGQESASTTLTKFQFRNLFTFDELVGIDNYQANANMNPEQKAQVRTVLANFEAAQDISLLDAATQAGVGLLASVGLITEERATAILSGQAPA